MSGADAPFIFIGASTLDPPIEGRIIQNACNFHPIAENP